MKIGYFGTSYPDYRMIIQKVPEYEYVLVRDKREILNRALNFVRRIHPSFGRTEFYAQTNYFTLDLKEYPELDVIHTFSRVCLNQNNKWVATIEKNMPAHFCDEFSLDKRLIKKQAGLMASENCIALLPISQWAYDYQLWLLSQAATSKQIQHIRNKMRVLLPPQPLICGENEVIEKFQNINNKTIRFLFVGSQLHRKGGFEVLKALDELSSRGHRFRLDFVGNPENTVVNFYLTEEEKRYIEGLREKASWLFFYETLPNDQVIQLARQAHIGLLPTLGDTFGFSVLEMEACGCPVITTNRMALPEINDLESGWLLDTRKLQLLHGDDYASYSRAEIAELENTIHSELIRTIDEILTYPEIAREKALCALKRVKEWHSPEKYAAELRQIYKMGKKE